MSKKTWADVPEDAKEALVGWFNTNYLDDDERKMLADLFFGGRFTYGLCGHCNAEYQRGQPENWDNFQGCHNDEGIGELCEDCSRRELANYAKIVPDYILI